MLTVKLNHSTNFNNYQKAKLNSAIILLQKVVNSAEFKSRVLNFKYNGNYQFANNDGMSNSAIYDLIMSGAEVLSPESDNEIDIDITLYSSWFSRVIGYTYPGTLRTWVNAKYFNNMSTAGISSNIIHEWCHKLGFGHDFNSTSKRPYSVPYAIGYIVEELAARSNLTAV